MVKQDFFPVALFTASIALIVLFGVFTKYEQPSETFGAEDSRVEKYSLYQDVVIMVFVGFGYLMCFLHKHSFSAFGFTFLVSSFLILWAMLVIGFIHNLHDDKWEKIQIGIDMIVEGNFGAATFLISMGALLGKTNAAQLLVIGFFEMVFYGLNILFVALELKTADVGGSYVIHMFGAYFGLAASVWLSPSKKTQGADKDLNGSTIVSDTFACIGTIFLWIYWPSFNAVLCGPGDHFRAIVNTVLVLCMCVVGTYLFSRLLHPDSKFDMVTVQNSTLAGAVAMGSNANLPMHPAGALGIGLFASLISVIGYKKITPWLEAKFGLQDTCGINNLHGMPAILAALSSMIITASVEYDDFESREVFDIAIPKGDDQWISQFVALFVTLGISLTSGTLVGFLVSRCMSKPTRYFTDKEDWEVEDDEADESSVEHASAVQANLTSPVQRNNEELLEVHSQA
eukprot:GCRY01000235.1.p1 GENE.GCRY01000235.1~~GCRY01000235.1.p1  ORF type:complete len:456 (+),score=100.44 GCRY01000235.1:59-1426(+)